MSEQQKQKQLYVLYGSQMGNSEEAANTFCKELKKRYSTKDYLKSNNLPLTLGAGDNGGIETICIQLDDFLELHHAKFTTNLIVIFVSSYGVGQAPLGSYRFREICDEFINLKDNTLLQGLKYTICGLGDSSYPTYLKNPTTIDEGLTAAGAIRVGDLGKADAQEVTGSINSQDKVIERYIDTILVPVGKVLAEESNNDNEKVVDLERMQQNIIPLICKLDPDYKPPEEENKKKKKGGVLGIFGLGAALLGIALAVVVSSVSSS